MGNKCEHGCDHDKYKEHFVPPIQPGEHDKPNSLLIGAAALVFTAVVAYMASIGWLTP